MNERAEELFSQLLHHMDPTLWVAFTLPDFKEVTGQDPEEVVRARCKMVTEKLKELQGIFQAQK